MTSIDAIGQAQRRANAVACLTALRDTPSGWTIRQLATHTGLSRPTVEAVLRDLIATSPVSDDHGAHAVGAGRPARRFSFDPDAGSVAGLDAGPHVTRLMLTNLAGTVLARDETATDGVDGRARIGLLHQFLADTCRTAGAGPLRGVGLSVPGIVDPAGRISHSIATPSWVGLDVAAELSDLAGCRVVLDNDVKAAALAEHRLRDPQPDHMLFLQLGNRVSLALVVNGQVLQGSHRIAGELGTRRGMRWTRNSDRGQLRWQSAPTASEVFVRAEAGDRRSVDEVESFCTEIAPLVATIALTVDPEIIVVGGGLSRAGRVLLDPLSAAIHEQLTVAARPELVTSLLRSTGPSVGALGLAFEQLSTQLFGVGPVRPPWQQWTPQMSHPTPTT